MWAGPLLDSALLYLTPILLAALGELVVERGGVVNIGIEGMMLAGALGGFAANAMFGPIAGIMGAALGGLLLGGIFAGVSLHFGADQIVSGAGINLLAVGGTGFLFRWLEAHWLADRVVTPVSPYILAALVPVAAGGIWAFFRFTRGGMELASIGEAPQAADAAGVGVQGRQLYAILFGSACAGVAGGYLSTMRTANFQENMTGGQGFLALALVIFGRWNAVGVVVAGVSFALLRSGAEKLNVQGTFDAKWSELLKVLPYVVSLLALAGVAGRSGSPAALGKPFARA